MRLPVDPEVAERLARLDVPFNSYGLDRFGISRPHLAQFFTVLSWLYRHYFRVRAFGLEHVPAEGRAMLIGNHSGGLPVDAGMLLTSLILELEPPRLAHGMVEKFAQTWPFVSTWFSRIGQLPGLPENAVHMLRADRLLMVFPEGARGTGKLYRDRYTLVRFGTGFMRLAMQTRTPIVPFAFVGGEEALKTLYHSKLMAKLTGAPYWPVPPHIVPVPLPTPCSLHFGAPMTFEGDGDESDEIIQQHIDAVRARILELIEDGRQLRRERVAQEVPR